VRELVLLTLVVLVAGGLVVMPAGALAPEAGTLRVVKVVDWNGVTPDQTQTFEICIRGQSYPTPDCQIVDYDGAVLNWPGLISGTYTVTETNPGTSWTVTGSPQDVGVAGGLVLATMTNTRNGEGCTPGFWKKTQHFNSWTGWYQDDSFAAVFGVPYDKTMLTALKTGGGQEKALGRHAVAALLNAGNPDVDYAFTQAEVIALVQDAWATGDFEGSKNVLAYENELGCHLY
jgi:hypothetical protein